MNRSAARECAMQMLFQMDIQNDFSENNYLRFTDNYDKDIDEASLLYIKKIFEVFTVKHSEIDSLIESNLKNWRIGRLSKVALACMRVCLTEAYYTEDLTPVNVAVSEAVRIVKKYAGDDDGKYLNGVLGVIIRNRQ